MIHSIMKEGVWISDLSQIKEEFLNFFKEKFKDHDSNMDFPPFSNSFGLCALDHDSLETHVSLDEVKNEVWDCGSSKAPDPNWLYRVESEKDCIIIDRIDHGQWRWNWSRPNLGARNSADLLDMLFEISFAEINKVEETYVWSLGIDETFSVKDARCIIDSKILPSLAPSTVWDKNIPRKVNIFIWRLISDRFPHKLNLSFYGIDIQAISCPS
ncbi:hypothetical protein Tco_0904254 [Tanacetum coccineum]